MQTRIWRIVVVQKYRVKRKLSKQWHSALEKISSLSDVGTDAMNHRRK